MQIVVRIEPEGPPLRGRGAKRELQAFVEHWLVGRAWSGGLSDWIGQAKCRAVVRRRAGSDGHGVPGRHLTRRGLVPLPIERARRENCKKSKNDRMKRTHIQLTSGCRHQ